MIEKKNHVKSTRRIYIPVLLTLLGGVLYGVSLYLNYSHYFPTGSNGRVGQTSLLVIGTLVSCASLITAVISMRRSSIGLKVFLIMLAVVSIVLATLQGVSVVFLNLTFTF